jgi:ketosteroid isomerase-like protein
VSAEAIRVVEQIQGLITEEDVVATLEDEEAGKRIRARLATLAAPDFETVMVGPDYQQARFEFEGPDGFREAWLDWTSAFESYAIEIEEMIEAGDRVVSLVAMSGTTKTGGAEIPSPGAAVWTVVDGRVRRVEFHLDRDVALRAAGLEPDDRARS